MNNWIISRALCGTALGTAVLLTGLAFGPSASAKRPAPKRHAAKPARKAADAGAWRPDTAMFPLLQPERPIGDYLLRFPKGFEAKEETQDGKFGTALACVAIGAKRPDGSAPSLILINGHAAPGGVALSVDTLMKGSRFKMDRPGVVETDTQDGRNGSLDMSRRYFKYPDPEHPGHVMHGFLYATTDSRTNCVVIAADVEPYSKTTLPMLEAAALTLRKP